MKNNIAKTIFFALASISLLGSCKKQCVSRFSKKIEAINFNSIQVNGNFLVSVIKGDSFDIVTDGCEDDVLDVQATKEGSNLRIDFKTPTKQHSVVGVKITMPTLSAFDISGTSSIRFTGWTSFKYLKGGVSGVCYVELNSQIDTLLLSLSGQSKARIAGSTTLLNASVSGQSDLDTYGTTTNQKSEVVISGQSEAKILCKQELKADVSGQSKLRYKGNPVIRNITVSGQSSAIAE